LLGGGLDLGGILPNGDNSGGGGQIDTLAPAAPFVTNISTTPSQPGASGQKWLVMLYQDADDQVLEKDICFDLNEAEKAGPSSGVTIVSQLDRFAGSYTGDGNWNDTRRFLITQDSNLNQLSSTQIANLGEANMSDPKTLVDFVTWAVQAYPADKYALILSDHGMGWPGGWSDATPRGSVNQAIPLQASMGDMLYLNELDDALNQIRTTTNIDKFELIGLDACLMAQLEVFTALAPHARYAVASEETEPALGWAYTAFLQALNQNPGMDGAGLASAIIKSYIEEDQSIIDSSARANFLSKGSPFAGLFGPVGDSGSQGLAQEIGRDTTLSAVDLNQMNAVNTNLNKLAFALQGIQQQSLASSRSYAQRFTSVFGDDVPPSYIDLGNFLSFVKQKSGSTAVNQAADAVLASIAQAVVAEKHGAGMPGATGIAIYFPNSELYGYGTTGPRSYTAIANRFAAVSLWDDFLAYHYSGRTFAANDAMAVIPTGTVRSPAAGGITISAIRASASQAGIGQPVTLSADISGENIGYIYLFAGYYDAGSNSVFVADRDYLESGLTRQINGVYYPDWGDGAFTLQFTWDPVVFAASDGVNDVPALFAPSDFGRTYEEAVYTVDGTYTFASSGQRLAARLYFVDGVLRRVFGFTGQLDLGAPREITPAAGDKFNVSETWLDLDSSGKVVNTTIEEGPSLTFGSNMFTWQTLDAAAGVYMVGFVVEDLDGNQQWSLIRITVN
jgi:hypothetical protein